MNGPSHRDPESLAVEYCDLCGAPVGAADRIRGEAQGLAGLWLCPIHTELGTNLSWLDLGGQGSAPNIEMDEEPHSGLNPFEEAKKP